MYLYNSPEYCETNFAALKIRGVPINVNYRYLDNELHYLLDNADVEALVFHTLARPIASPRAVRARRRAPAGRGRRRPGARRHRATSTARSRYERAPGRRCAGGADRRRRATRLYIFYTGGTTGMPKGVMYPTERVHRVLPAVVPADDRPAADRRPAGLPATRRGSMFEAGTPLVAMSGPPLMHGTGCWLGMMVAAPVRRHRRPARASWPRPGRALGRRRAGGRAAPHRRRRRLRQAAAARPRRRSPIGGTLSSLRLMISSGAMFSAEVKHGLIDHLPAAGHRRRARLRPRAAWARRSRPRTRRRPRRPSSR